MQNPLKTLAFSVSLCWLAIAATPAHACGSDFAEPVFVFSGRPDNFADFAQGNLGIIQPNWNRTVLFRAYRELLGIPLSASEQQGLIRNWQAEFEQKDTDPNNGDVALNHWLTVRKQAFPDLAEPGSIGDYRTLNANAYHVFLNCASDAFETASKTLQARLASYPGSAAVKDWLTAQDLVFANCTQTSSEQLAETAADAPDWLKRDRAYQIAAAHFYAMRWQEAQDGFGKIAADSASEWQSTAKYLLARLAVRQARVYMGDDAHQQKTLYEQALPAINAVLADPQAASFHAAAQQLLNFVNYRINPENAHNTLAKKLLEPAENPYFFQNLVDYRYLLNSQEYGQTVPSTQAMRQASELTDWLFTVQYQSGGYIEPSGDDAAAAFRHAYERWQSSQSLPWLVACLMKAAPNTPESTHLLHASSAVKADSPAYLTVNYHVARLLSAQGQSNPARKILDTLLALPKARLNSSTISLLYQQRMLLAQNVDELVKYSQRQATAFAWNGFSSMLVDLSKPKEGEDYYRNEREWLDRNMFDADARRTLNLHTPLSLLKQIALHKDLPDYLKRRLVMSVWMRAVLLGNDASAQAFTPQLIKYLPELEKAIKPYRQAKNQQARFYEAVWLMLNHPGMRPLVEQGEGRTVALSERVGNGNDWWCDDDLNSQYVDDYGNPQSDLPSPSFYSRADIAQAADENAKLAALTGGSNFLANQVVAWAKYNPNDKRLPEALALAVKATRYGGCQNCATGKASKAAFDLLHKRFQGSTWQKQTPYWFGQACEKS
ncbi:hypothetical protein JCM14076_01690 [Methylosoma difficile]